MCLCGAINCEELIFIFSFVSLCGVVQSPPWSGNTIRQHREKTNNWDGALFSLQRVNARGRSSGEIHWQHRLKRRLHKSPQAAASTARVKNPQRKLRARPTDAHLEQRCRGPRTPRRWRSLWDRRCSRSERPGPRSRLSARRWGRWTRRSRPSRSSTRWAGRKRRGLSRKLSGSAWCNRSRTAGAPLRSPPRRRHLEQTENMNVGFLRWLSQTTSWGEKAEWEPCISSVHEKGAQTKQYFLTSLDNISDGRIYATLTSVWELTFSNHYIKSVNIAMTHYMRHAYMPEASFLFIYRTLLCKNIWSKPDRREKKERNERINKKITHLWCVWGSC